MKINIAKLSPLNEGNYDAILLSLEFVPNLEGNINYLDIQFKVKGRTIKDRLFGTGDARYYDFLESIQRFQDSNGDIDTDAFKNIDCKIELANYESNGRIYQHTSDWAWAEDTQQVLDKHNSNKDYRGAKLIDQINAQSTTETDIEEEFSNGLNDENGK